MLRDAKNRQNTIAKNSKESRKDSRKKKSQSIISIFMFEYVVCINVLCIFYWNVVFVQIEMKCSHPR